MPTFNNHPNEMVDLSDGRQVWLSRACAVIAEICLYDKVQQQWFILLGKRGSGTPDFQGYWGLPCGYLDWNETLSQAVIREVWEECGLYLPTLNQQSGFITSNSLLTQTEKLADEMPWAISDAINNNKQNVSMHFAVLVAWQGAPLPSLSYANAEPNEVEALAWVEINQAKTQTLAFNHHLRIAKLCDDLQGEMQKIEQAVK